MVEGISAEEKVKLLKLLKSQLWDNFKDYDDAVEFEGCVSYSFDIVEYLRTHHIKGKFEIHETSLEREPDFTYEYHNAGG